MERVFEFEKLAFISAMNVVAKAVPTRSTMPILQYVLLRNDNGRCSLEASDISHTIRMYVESTKQPSAFTGVLIDPHKSITIACQSANTVAIVVDDSIVRVVADTGAQLTMPTVDPSTWPIPAESSMEYTSHTLSCTGDRLATAINYVLPACDTSDGRYAFSGVQLTSRHLIATNGKILHWHSLFEPAEIGENGICVIPSKTIATMMIASRRYPGDLGQLTVAGNIVTLEIGDARVSGTTISGKFPSFANLMPKGKSKVANVDASTLADAIGVVLMAADSEMQTMTMTGEEEEIKIECSCQHAECVSKIDYSGNWIGLDIKLNPHFLRSAVKPIDGEVKIEWYSKEKPIIGHSGCAGFLLMPMSI